MAQGDITLVKYNVTKRGSRWVVHSGGRVLDRRFSSQSAATDHARELADSGQAIAVHDSNGTITRKIDM